MASIAIMIGGAVLNATAFIGGNYLARALGGGDKAALEEKKRHDKALEDYQAAYAKYTRDRTQLLDWIATNAQTKAEAKENFTNTDCTFKLYNQAHPDEKMTAPQGAQVHRFLSAKQAAENRLKYCRLTPGANSWELSQKRWTSTKHISGAGALTFTATRPLSNVSTAPWLSGCSGTSTPLKCFSLSASGPLPG